MIVFQSANAAGLSQKSEGHQLYSGVHDSSQHSGQS